MSLTVDTNVLEAPTFLGDVVLELSGKLVCAVNGRKLEAAEREVVQHTSELNDSTKSWTRQSRLIAERRLEEATKRRDFIARTML